MNAGPAVDVVRREVLWFEPPAMGWPAARAHDELDVPETYPTVI